MVLTQPGVFIARGFVERCDFFMIPQAGPTKNFDVDMYAYCILYFYVSERMGIMLWDTMALENWRGVGAGLRGGFSGFGTEVLAGLFSSNPLGLIGSSFDKPSCVTRKYVNALRDAKGEWNGGIWERVS